MNNEKEELIVKNLDHLGLTTGFIDELGLVEEIDRLIPSERKVSIGAMFRAWFFDNTQSNDGTILIYINVIFSKIIKILRGYKYRDVK